MKFRFGDKPNRMYPDSLDTLEEQGFWIATQKLDGWRCHVFRDDSRELATKWGGHASWGNGTGENLFFVSRRDIDSGGPTQFPVNDELIDLVEGLDLPDQSMLDCEWAKMRTIDQIPERMYAFGVLWLNNKWMGGKLEQDRAKLLDEIVGADESPLMQPPKVESGYRDFFNLQKEIEHSEGIVLKHTHSKLVGSRSESAKNKQWIKIRYRDGASGRDVYYD